MEKSIELDCSPGTQRPNVYIRAIFKDTEFEYDGRPPVSTFFGCWKWDFSDIPDDVWVRINKTIGKRISDLHNSGRIRYGSW